MAFAKGDRVRVTTHEFDSIPGGTQNTGYGYGVTGVIHGFRNNRFHGRQAIVELDNEPGAYVDWTLTNIERVSQNSPH